MDKMCANKGMREYLYSFIEQKGPIEIEELSRMAIWLYRVFPSFLEVVNDFAKECLKTLEEEREELKLELQEL